MYLGTIYIVQKTDLRTLYRFHDKATIINIIDLIQLTVKNDIEYLKSI